MKIPHCYTGAILYEDDSPSMRKTVEAAVAAGVDLSGADLRGADLRGIHIPGANLRGAHITGADLRGAHITGADLRGANLRGAHITGADLSGADLRGANLRGAHITDVDLRGANLRGADLRGAHLTGASIIDAGQDSRGYRWVAVRQTDVPYRILAGCHWFTHDEAWRHWKASHKNNPWVNYECLARLDLIATLAKVRGWRADSA